MAKKSDALNLFPQASQNNSAALRKTAGRSREAQTYSSDLERVWEQCLEIIRDNVSVQVFKTWFEPIKVLSFDGTDILVEVPSQFYYEWLEEHYTTLIQRSVAQTFGSTVHLKYQVVMDTTTESLEERTIILPAMRHGNQGAVQSKLPFSTPTEAPVNHSSFLNPRYTFDNFVSGDSNQLAFSASVAVTESAGKSRYNPLVIYGKTGLGKTHLVQAIGNRIVEKNKRARVLYTTSERFTMEYVSALQTNRFSEFTEYYRSMDVLIIDDIQFFAGKEKTQDNFFHTFNALLQAGKQIILTSDVAPSDLRDVDARLISRFQWGLTADVQSPDYEMRLAIVQRKSADEGLQIPEEIAEYIARHVTSSIRQIEGCLIRLFASVSLDNRRVSLPLVQEVVNSVVGEPRQRPLHMEDIKVLVASYYSLPVELLAGKTRKHEIVLARQVAMYLAKQLTNLSLKSIGSHFGGRDHTTVLHSIQMIENYFDTDQTVTQTVEHLHRKLSHSAQG